jgi:hypothetical protein
MSIIQMSLSITFYHAKRRDVADKAIKSNLMALGGCLPPKMLGDAGSS